MRMQILVFVSCIILQFCALAEFAEKTGNFSTSRVGINPADYVTIGDKKYYISPLGQRVWEAQVYCNADGMKLISFEDQDKMKLIYDYLTKNGYSQTIWTSGEKWQGLWRWSAIGQVFTFTNWTVNEPDETATDIDICVYFQSEKGWYDADCDFHIHFMCEY